MPIEWITPEWPAPPNVRALSTLRGGGVSAGRYASLNLGDHVGDLPQVVAENRRRLRAAAALPAEPVWLSQVHGTHIADLDAAPAGQAPGEPAAAADSAGSRPVADGSVTRVAGRVCAILTADCLPVLLAAESGTAVAAAHAGWRGLKGGVLEAAVQALGIAPGSLLAWLGPGIGRRAFEVGAEVREQFVREDAGAEAGFTPNARGRFMADLPGLARRRLERLGVTRIYGGTECTHADEERYFSYRRDGETGRQATFVWLTAEVPQKLA